MHNPLMLVLALAQTSSAAASAEFRVEVGPGAETLTVEADLPAGTGQHLVLEDGGEQFLRDVQLEVGGRWRRLEITASGLPAMACSQGCRLRYRFLLREAARSLGETSAAAAFGPAFVSPPSVWLLHPPGHAALGYRLSFKTPAATSALCGLSAADGPGTYQSSEGLEVSPLCAFGPWRLRTLRAAGAPVTLAIAPAPFSMSDEDMERWVTEATQAVAAYYRRFPVEQLLLLVVPHGAQGLSGFTLGEGGAMLRDTVAELIEQGQRKIMLNLRRVTYIDSSGIGELVRALSAARGRGGELELVNLSLPVNEVLKITRLAALFEVAQDESAGAKSFRASA